MKFLLEFASKRNRVFLVLLNNVPVILKIFRLKRAAMREWQMLYRLKTLKLAAPEPLMMFKNWIVRQFVDGISLKELLHEGETEWAEKLAQWLYKFHNFTGMKLFDVSLDNFLYYNSEIYCVDFDQVRRSGSQLEDVGKLAMNLLKTSSNPFEKNLLVTKNFLKTYSELSGIPILKFKKYVEKNFQLSKEEMEDTRLVKEIKDHVPEIFQK